MHLTRIRVREDMVYDGVAIHMMRDEGSIVLLPDFATLEWKETPENATIEAAPLLLDRSAAKLLYEELKRYYGDVHDSAMLRMDYMGERSRVDKFINAVVEGRL